ncbi:cyanophycin synthetase [Pusillimonas noertemannii]|uniref:Cyanophycin synthetase n=1 Tax=Pusillimonas noertemannii TaxID=305977 RepID=A0A2U1CK38_9BURK|nr:cyanophycin synthetase [Pusillimonas noertemannii]NYT69724.1 cyanophycin synthetase [Pusillimonas noertemannii]PVY61352.1 cyanophycin synthetase [Pusillimonas noertemannii]TFL09036.1 cyanophycin synthetase [Pusillimonas noertemannii]
MKKFDVVFRNTISLRGPSIWTYPPSIETWIDIGELEDFPSNRIPGLYERLSAWMPSLIEHRCNYDERGGFLRRVREGTWAGHILEHIVIELMALAGLPDGFGRTRETTERGVYKMVVSNFHDECCRLALATGREVLLAAIHDEPFSLSDALKPLRRMVDRKYLGPSTAAIVAAAEERAIPHIRLLEDGNLVQLGHGSAMRRIWTAETDHTSAIAEAISRDKNLTKELIGALGVPVPEGREVNSATDAIEAAHDIGFPVVVKPVDGNHGRGVFIDLKGEEEVARAYAIAVEEGSGVLVERSISGTEHRLLIVGGRLVAANRSDFITVTGDGRHTVQALIDRQINSDPRRGLTELHPLSVVRIDTAAGIELERQGLHADSVPARGRVVLIQRNANHAFDCTDEVHPDTAEAAALAARVVGLDIAGIDLVCDDIGKPLSGQGGAIVEVNAGPGLLMHIKPGEGKTRPVGEAIVANLFAPHESGRIPLVGVSGTEGRTPVARLVAHMLYLAGRHAGLACADGLFLGRRQVHDGGAVNWADGRRLLLNRAVEAAVIESSAELILGEGLAYDRCSVGVVTNILPQAEDLSRWDVQPDGSEYYTTPRAIYRSQVDVVLPSGHAVLNAEDERVAGLAGLCDGKVIFFALDRRNATLEAHLESGGHGVFLAGGCIALSTGRRESSLCLVDDVPLIGRPGRPGDIAAVLAAVAAGWALGLTQEVIGTAVKTYGLELPEPAVAHV